LAGPFTIFRKEQKYLYKGNSDYKKVFTSEESLSFDETNFIYNENIFSSKSPATRGKNGIKSMTHYVAELVENGKIKLYANSLVVNLKLKEKTEIEFDNGKLVSDKIKEIFLVHFLLIRINNKLLLPELTPIKNNFFISSCGIYYDKKPFYFKKMEIYAKITVLTYVKVKIGRFLARFFPKLYYFYKKYKYKKVPRI